MEISKVHNLYYDLLEENKVFSLSETSSVILRAIQNVRDNNDLENQTKILHSRLVELHEVSKISIVEMLTTSDIEYLVKTKILKYFGIYLYEEIQSLLKNAINSHEQFNSINNFFILREKKIKDIEIIIDKFNELEIEPYHQSENYDIGIRIPINNKSNKLINLAQLLKEFNFMLRTLNEIHGNSVEDYEISLVSNGSIILYVTQNPEIATTLSEIFKDIAIGLAALSTSIIQIKDLKDKKFKSTAIKMLEEDVENKINEKLDDIVEKVVNKFQGDEGRKHELRKATKNTVKNASNFIKDEIEIEFVAPVLPEKDEFNQDRDEKSQLEYTNRFNEKIKKIKNITETMKNVKEIIENGKEVLDLITYDKSEDTSND